MNKGVDEPMSEPSPAPNPDPYGPVERGPRWDPVVRLTHWAIAVAVLLNGLITEDGEFIHTVVGYTALGLLALRLLWGFIGPEAARFTSFPPSLKAALHHAGDMLAGRQVTHRSHNPIGALMVYALWCSLLLVLLTGVAMDRGRLGERGSTDRAVEQSAVLIAPAYANDEDRHDREGEREGEREEGILGEIHEFAANLLLILAGLHILGVALESKRRGENLARSMLTGRSSKERT